MIDRNRTASQLRVDEGEKLKPYKDTVGVLTIGVGINLDDGLTKEESEFLLQSRITRAENFLIQNLPWYAMLDPIRQEVLVNMCYNLGWVGLSQFKNTLDLVRTGKYDAAANAMLQSKWATQVGDRAKRLAQKMREGK